MVVGLSKKSQGRMPSSSVSPSTLSLWRFPLRSDSLPFIRSAPDHHIVHNGGTQQDIEKLKNYLRTESELSSGISNTHDHKATPLRRKPSTFSLDVLDTHTALGCQSNPHLTGSSTSTYMLYCNSLMHLPDGKGHSNHALSSFTESTDSSSEETCTCQLDESSPFSRKGSRECDSSSGHSSEARASGSELLDTCSTLSRMARLSSASVTNDIIALYSCKCSSASCVCTLQSEKRLSRPEDDGQEPNQSGLDSSKASNKNSSRVQSGSNGPYDCKHKKDMSPQRNRSPSKLDLEAIRKLSDKHLFDAASVPLPETPSSVRILASVDSVSQQKVLDADHSHALLGSLDGTSEPPQRNGPTTGSKDVGCGESKFSQDQSMESAQDYLLKSLLREAEAKHQKEIEVLKQDFERQLLKQSQASQLQIEKYKTEINELTTDRDETQFMLEDYIATSGTLIAQKEAESDALTLELGKVTFERQRLQKNLDECESRSDALSSERKEAQERIELLVAENLRLEGLSNDLRNDVLVAEERNELIKKHAQKTLDMANSEITKLQKLLAQTKHDVTSLQTQTGKVDARAKSLQIQLNSTKQQNRELLELCERLENSLV
ncbi:hypothetical protein LPJ72_001140 [Coemansia sp. Benny D160-2]|nr:hypothetical protein LPJ72_001140 [Coemansia sp. Benny D160-2]